MTTTLDTKQSETVQAFLAANGVQADGRRTSSLGPYEAEIKQLAEGGASLRLIQRYLVETHAVTATPGWLWKWMTGRGIRLAGAVKTTTEIAA